MTRIYHERQKIAKTPLNLKPIAFMSEFCPKKYDVYIFFTCPIAKAEIIISDCL